MKRYDYEIQVCKECNGTKYVKVPSCTCEDCIINEVCTTCNGKGEIKVIRETLKK